MKGNKEEKATQSILQHFDISLRDFFWIRIPKSHVKRLIESFVSHLCRIMVAVRQTTDWLVPKFNPYWFRQCLTDFLVGRTTSLSVSFEAFEIQISLFSTQKLRVSVKQANLHLFLDLNQRRIKKYTKLAQFLLWHNHSDLVVNLFHLTIWLDRDTN